MTLPGGNTDTKLDRKTALTLFFKKLNLKLSLKVNLLIEKEVKELSRKSKVSIKTQII